MRQRAQYSIEHLVQPFAEVVAQESENEVAVFLERGIFAAVSAIGFCISKMLAAIKLDH